MAIQTPNFKFAEKTLSSFGFTCVDFDDNPDIPLGVSREIQKGDIIPTRLEANHFPPLWSDSLAFEIHIVKDPDRLQDLPS